MMRILLDLRCGWRMWAKPPSFSGVAVLALAAGMGANLVPGPSPARAPLPTTREVLERYVTVTGGRQALQRHKSMTIRGRLQLPARNLDLVTVSYRKDGKFLEKVFLPGGKESASGYNGSIAWDMDRAGRVTLPHGNEVRSIARDADMYDHLHVMNYFRSLSVVGVSEFAGHECYHLKGINNWGQIHEQFYDTRTGLLAGYAFPTAWRGGAGAATMRFEEYRKFAETLVPTRIVEPEGNHISISLVTSVTYDDVKDSVFRLPEAVERAVVGKN